MATSGHIRINKDKISSASKTVRIGDVLTIALERRVLVLKVAALGTRRGPFAEAQETPTRICRLRHRRAKPRHRLLPVSEKQAPGGQRKRDRRQIDSLREPD